jgi:Rrf2 family protein
MLTAKGKYGLKALIHLASLMPGETAVSAEIAAANNISKKFLDSILGKLRDAGLILAKKGPGGGYTLAKAAHAIKVGNAIRELDGPLAPIACASRSAYRPCRDCRDPGACAIRMSMVRVRDAISDVLDSMTLAELVTLDRAGRRRLQRAPTGRQATRRRPAGRSSTSG